MKCVECKWSGQITSTPTQIDSNPNRNYKYISSNKSKQQYEPKRAKGTVIWAIPT